MVTKNQEDIDTSWAANSTARELYEMEATGFIGTDVDSDEQESTFSKDDFEDALKKVVRKVKK